MHRTSYEPTPPDTLQEPVEPEIPPSDANTREFVIALLLILAMIGSALAVDWTIHEIATRGGR